MPAHSTQYASAQYTDACKLAWTLHNPDSRNEGRKVALPSLAPEHTEEQRWPVGRTMSRFSRLVAFLLFFLACMQVLHIVLLLQLNELVAQEETLAQDEQLVSRLPLTMIDMAAQ